MNLSDLLQQATEHILDVQLSDAKLSEFEEQLQSLQLIREDILLAQGQLARQRAILARHRGQITNMMLHLDKLSASLSEDDDALGIALHIATKGVTQVGIVPRGFKRQRATTPAKAKPTQSPQRTTQRAKQDLRAMLTKNPQLLQQLQGQLLKMSQQGCTAPDVTDDPDVE